MYRLLIVDDDEILRQGLVQNIDWNKNGIEVVAQAKNGKEAIKQIQIYMPEIILSDIRMPFMDGIELSKYVYEYYPQIKMLLLSAYEEFEYAKKAIQYHVSDYIMKYESNDVILDRIQQMIQQYEIDKKHNEMIDRNKDYLLRDLIQQLCFNHLEDEEIKLRTQSIGEKFNQGVYGVLSFAVETYNSKRQTRLINLASEKQLITFIGQFLQNNQYDYVVFQDKESMKFVVNYTAKKALSVDELQKELEALIVEMESSNPINMNIGGGGFYHELADIHKSYLEAEEAMSILKLMENGNAHCGAKVMLYGGIKNKQENMADMIDKVVKYIDLHYADQDLSLNSIANFVYLSPNYISTLFKKYKDINLSNYIIQVRMDIAEKLLKESDYKAYEIANMVGYTNSQYFSILFKRSKGVSPSDYRQQNL